MVRRYKPVDVQKHIMLIKYCSDKLPTHT